MTRIVNLKLDELRLDGGTQPRAALSGDTVTEYREAILAGQKLPPLKAVWDGTCYWLYGGFHRWQALKDAGRTKTAVEVRSGTLDEARWLALAENLTHGQRRTNADKHAAAVMALQNWPEKTDRALADHAGVNHHLLSKIRSTLPDKAANGSQHTGARENAETQPQTAPSSEAAPSSVGSTPNCNGQSQEEESGKSAPKAPSKPAARTGRDGKSYQPAKPASEKLLCDRCRRTGAVLNCKACEAFRNGKNTSEPTKPPPTKPSAPKSAVLDKEGSAVPDRCRDAFADPSLAVLIEAVRETRDSFDVAAWVKKVGQLCVHYPFLQFEGFAQHVNEALHQIQCAVLSLESGMPHAVCPECKGAESAEPGSRCKACRGCGHVPVTRYRELTGGAKV